MVTPTQQEEEGVRQAQNDMEGDAGENPDSKEENVKINVEGLTYKHNVNPYTQQEAVIAEPVEESIQDASFVRDVVVVEVLQQTQLAGEQSSKSQERIPTLEQEVEKSRKFYIILGAASLLVLASSISAGVICGHGGCRPSRSLTPSPILPTRVVTYSEYLEVLPNDLAPGDGFGGSVALHGDLLVVGSFTKDEVNNTDAGSAYIFRRQPTGGWVQEQKLRPSEMLAQHARFGRSVAVHGDRIIVGADYDDHAGKFSGSAYVFAYSGGRWLEEQKLVAQDATADSLFGLSVAIHGSKAFVGAPNENNRTGSVYIFSKDGINGTWSQERKLVAFNGAPGDKFGSAVSVNEIGNKLVAGAARGSSGSAYVYVKSRGGLWVELEKLCSTGFSSGDTFGRSVGISGDTIVVGATGKYDSVGSVFSFDVQGSEWSVQQEIQLANATDNAKFGNTLAVSGDWLAVSSRYGADGGESSSVHVYRKADNNEWREQYLLGAETNFRRATLAVDNNTVVLGSTNGHTLAGNRTGAVYVYRIKE